MGSRIWRIVGAAFVGMLGFGAVIPMLPVYLHEQAGASTFATGLLIGLSSAFALLGRLFAGKTADRKGRRTALLAGMALCVGAGVLYLPVFGLWAMPPARVLHGLGEGFFVTACVAWAVDVAPDNRRGQALGYLSSGIWGGVSIGPAIGQAIGSMSAVAVFLAVSSLAVIGMVLVMKEEPRPYAHVKSRWLPRPVLLPGVMLGLGNVTYAAMAGFLILLLRNRGHSSAWAFSAFALAVLFGRGLFGGLPDRVGPKRSLYAGYACMAAGLSALIAGRNGSALDVPASLLVGLGYAFPWPALASVVVGQVPATERASALGALNAFYDLFVAGSSAIAGAAAGKWGFTAPFWIALACVAFAVVLMHVVELGASSRVMAKAAILLLVASAAFGQTLELPRTVKQGGTLRISGPAAATSARMGERTVRLFPQNDGAAFGLMPVKSNDEPGEYSIELLDSAGKAVATAPVRVVDAHFRKQNVTIEPGLAEMKPSPGETETVTAFRNTVSETRYWSEPLDIPVRGCMTSPFGVQRYMNGKPTGGIHAGIDQRSPEGAPIHAVDGGVVKFAREWNLHGRTVGVDHGQGLGSVYLHMSRIAVTEGATVKKGDIVGYVGSTGRSTAPHLHWSLYVNSVPVNPLDWIKVSACGAKAAPGRGGGRKGR